MKTWLAIPVLFFSLSSYADNIYVAPVQGTNVGKKETASLRELIKIEIQGDSNHRVVDNMDEAQFFLQTKVIKFDQYTLSMTRWQGDQKVSTGQWKANSLTDLESKMPAAVSEVVNSQINKNSAIAFDDSKSLGEQAAEKNLNYSTERVQARKQVTVGFGPTFFDNMNTGDSGLGFQAGYLWVIDDHFDLGINSDFAINTEHSDAFMLTGKIITNYFFTRNDISPFVGAGFGYGWASIHGGNSAISDDSASGFALGLHGGIKFFRTSTVNLAVTGEYTRIMNKSSLGQPGVFLLKVALHF